jgi:hypothetical protein
MSTENAVDSPSAHTLNPARWGEAAEAMARALPPVAFAGLEAGRCYYYRKAGDGCMVRSVRRLVRATRVTRGGRQADFAFLPDEDTTRVHAGDFPGEFYPLDAPLVSVLLTPHRQFVVDAFQRGEGIPGEVKRHYPEMFVTLPAGVNASELATLLTGWKTLTSGADVMACIESTQDSLRAHDRDSAMLVVRGGSTQQVLDVARNSLLERLALYAWLDPLVSDGGVFAV